MGPCMCGGCVRCLHDQGQHCGNQHCESCRRMAEREGVCPACGGEGVALGTLGALLHLRCRDCGMDFSVDAPDSYEEND